MYLRLVAVCASLVVFSLQIMFHVFMYHLRFNGGGMRHPIALSGTFVFLMPMLIADVANYLLSRRAWTDLIAVVVAVTLGIAGIALSVMVGISMYGS